MIAAAGTPPTYEDDALTEPASAGTSTMRCSAAPGLTRELVAPYVLGVPSEIVRALGGLNGDALRDLIEAVNPQPDTRRALLVPIVADVTAHAIAEQIIAFLASAAARLWPVWYTDVDFGHCPADRLGRLTTGIMASAAAKSVAGASLVWAERAASLALEGKAPRPPGTLPATEIAQLALAISRTRLTLVVEMEAAIKGGADPAALVHALEWTAKNSHCAVVALFDELPPNEPPFDRILFEARRLCFADAPVVPNKVVEDKHENAWLAPWRGRPHPLSDIEKRLANALSADAELGSLFAFNQMIPTVRGTLPKVDLLWAEGLLVVEIDGYESHGNRRAFMDDRHRDYELMLSGYWVLRLANDEIAQDLGKAVDKIRDLVRMRRAHR